MGELPWHQYVCCSPTHSAEQVLTVTITQELQNTKDRHSWSKITLLLSCICLPSSLPVALLPPLLPGKAVGWCHAAAGWTQARTAQDRIKTRMLKLQQPQGEVRVVMCGTKKRGMTGPWESSCWIRDHSQGGEQTRARSSHGSLWSSLNNS